MASRERDEEKSFLSRWSQRKRAAEAEAEAETGRKEEAAPEAAAASARPPAAEPAQDGVPEGEIGAFDPADLPDIDSLDADSDFTVFFKDGVPDALRRQALRKLWRLDPVFGHLDGLNDYDLDYTNAATVVEGLKTVYQVGKGMVLGEEEEKAPTEGAEAAEVPAAGGDISAAAADEAPSPDDMAAPAQVTEQPAEPAPAAPARNTRTRNPGDPVVTAVPTPRRSLDRAPKRTALERRWGDPDDPSRR